MPRFCLEYLQKERGMSKEEIFQFLTDNMTKEELDALQYDWNFWAREKQLMPEDKPYRGYFLVCGRGFGKGNPKSMQILTTSGWKLFGELVVGDRVFDEAGQPTMVTATFDRPPVPCYEFTFSDGEKLVSDTEHRWRTWTHRDRKQFNRYPENGAFPPHNWPLWRQPIFHGKYKKIVGHCGPSIKTTQEIVDTFYIGRRKDRNHSIPLCMPVALPKKVVRHPWVYGYWLGNGCRYKNDICCHSSDTQEIHKALAEQGIRFKVFPNEHRKCAIIRIYDKFDFFKTDKSIIQEYLYSSIQDRLEVLRGLMDSDGHVKRSHVEFCAVRKEHAEAVLWLARSLGEKPVLTEGRAMLDGKDYGTKYRVTWTPCSVNPFSLSRKVMEVRLGDTNQQSRNCQRMIVKAEFVGVREDIRCISVDSPNAMYLAGEGLIPSMNTRSGSEWVIQRAKAGKGPIALIGATIADTLDVMLYKYDSSIMKVSPPNFKPLWEPSKRTVTWPNGVVATTFSAEDPEQLRGPQHQTAWIDEPCKIKSLEEVYDHMNQGLRVGSDPRWLATTTPKPMKLMRKWTNDPRIHVVTGSTYDNQHNLPQEFLDDIFDKYEGTTIGEQEIYGKILFEAEHGLWKREIIDRHRVYLPPPLEVVAIGVDPATSSKRASNATGISVAGAAYSQINMRREAYVLDDATCKGPPSIWALRVKTLMDKYKATKIIAESNQGGEMVRDVLVKYGVPDWRIKLVHAGQSKYDRAQPIAALCEQGKVHHVGTDNLQALEDELVAFEGLRDKRNSPDRMDAYVHVLDELLTSEENKMIVKHIRI